MSKLGELICEFCSNEVETVKIKNAFQRLKGTPITAARMKEINNPEGEIKVFAGGKTVIFIITKHHFFLNLFPSVLLL